MKNRLHSHVSISHKPHSSVKRVILLGSCLLASMVSSSVVFAWGDDDDGPVIRTAEGPVRGFTRNGVHEFLGIPYAAPPVGELRWMPPEAPKSWERPLNATHFRNTCAQVTELG